MKKILLATDGSKSAQYAAEFLAHLPHDETIELTVVSALYVPGASKAHLGDWVESCLASERKIARQAFEAVEQVFAGADVRVKSVVREGHPAETIVAIAREVGPELLVMGATGRSGVERMLLGSTSDYVATHAPCSVLVVRPTDGLGGTHPLRVAIAYEPSEPAQAALDEFAEFRWGTRTDVQIVSVVRADDVVDQKRQSEAVDEVAGQLSVRGEKASGRIVKNDHVGEGLVDFAQVNDIDLMVVGETPRTRLSRMLLGSMTRFVLRHATCGVWITRNRMIQSSNDEQPALAEHP